MSTDSVHVRTLARAALIVGSEELLALRLAVDPEVLRRWLQGQQQPPIEAFLRAVDIVVAESTRPERLMRPERDGAL